MVKFKTFMVAKAVVCLALGVPILFAPYFLYGLFGIVLGAGGAFAGREYAASMLGAMFMTWLVRDVTDLTLQKPILWWLLVYDLIGAVITLIAITSGVLNWLGWGAFAIYLFFAASGVYLLFFKSQST